MLQRSTARPRRHHRSRHLVPRYVGETGQSLVAHPGVPVAAAHPGGLDPEHHPILRKLGVGNIGDLEWLAKLGDQRGAHRSHHVCEFTTPPRDPAVGIARTGSRVRQQHKRVVRRRVIGVGR